jgi:hypothetical protein
MQLRKFRGRQRHVRHARRQRHPLLDPDAFEASHHGGRHRGRPRVLNRHHQRHIGGVDARQRQMRDDVRIPDSQRTRGHEFDALPDPRISIADARNPVPALGGDERRPVQRQGATIVSRPRRDRLLMGNAGMRRGRDAHRDRIGHARQQNPRHVEAAAHEGAANVPEPPTVQPHLRSVVDAVELEEQIVPLQDRGGHELAAVPIILARERFRNRQVVQAVIRVRVNAASDQRGQHRPRHHRPIPIPPLVVRP